MTKLPALFLVLSVAVAACSSSSGASGQCQALFDDFCSRFGSCFADAGAAAGVSSCDSQGTSECANAKTVTGNYGACVSAIETSSCATLFPGTSMGITNITPVLPMVCTGVILQ